MDARTFPPAKLEKFDKIPQRENETREEYIARVSILATGIAPRRLLFSDRVVQLSVRSVKWTFQHWLAIINTINGFTLAGAFLVPWLHKIGQHTVANFLFPLFQPICTQIYSHSYLLWGYQMGMCERDTAIYAAYLGSGLIYAILRKQWFIKPLSWFFFGLLSVPIAADGLTQLAGWRESNWELRSISGVLFALALVWACYPAFDLAITNRLKLNLGLAPNSAKSRQKA